MPNHVHGIVVIQKYGSNQRTRVETPNLGVSTGAGIAHGDHKTGGKNKNWEPGTLGVIINQFKRVCTIHIRKTDIHFGWQSRYHDHIIRDGISYDRISEYIKNNPQKWENRFFKLI